MADPKFEEALNKLESIVSDLESGDLGLDEAIKKYEEGMKLSNFCHNKLQEIQKKVEVLVKDSSGSLSAKDFNPDAKVAEEDSTQKEKKPKTQAKKKRPRGEQLLF
ncbi:MAG: exodeoxyribonuclease VII small subunit [Candidatus Omnitrophica bacterium]|nr:exodeoxyribonuclease VII small subunit [Candidatus Omnitrophota bacterium]